MTVQYLFSERAHYMCPNMHFGIAVEICEEYNKALTRRILDELSQAHPLLRSVILEDAQGRPYYAEQESLQIPLYEREDANRFLEDYEKLTSEGWDLRRDCMLKVLAYRKEDCIFLVFAAHHLLCDGMALLQLVQNFVECYVNHSKTEQTNKDQSYVNSDAASMQQGHIIPANRDRIIASADEFPSDSRLNFVTKCIVNSANRNWRKEGKKVSYSEYRSFEKEYVAANPFARTITTIEGEEYEHIIKQCREHKISVNDYLVAAMMVKEQTKKVIIGANIRNRIKAYEPGSLGNFSSACSVVVKGKPQDIYETDAQVNRQIAQIKARPDRELLVLSLYMAMDPDLIDAAAIATLGSFPSKAGAFVGGRLFGFEKRENYTITNLGRIQSTSIKAGYFIPPISPSSRKIAGVLTVNNTMKQVVCDRMC